jgi:dinuclear metal center YbgI/SA1388 family protein
MTTVKNIYDYINSVAPFDTQEEWDNSGFLLGEFRKEVKTCVLALDGTKTAAEFAKSVGAELLLTHHPVIFSPLCEVTEGSAVYELVKSGISVICAHTSFDKAEGGINTGLASLLGLKNTHRQDNGLVVVGELENEMSIDDFAEFTGETLGTSGLRYTDTDRLIKRVAVAGGACAEYISDAMAEADCFVTGDLKYHEMLEASENGYAVISAGHFETEGRPFLMLRDRLEKMFGDVKFIEAPIENPILSV